MRTHLLALLGLAGPAFGQYYTQEIFAPDGQAGDRFGTRVAVDGNWLACSAPEATGGGFTDAGAVYMYERQGAVWQYHSKLTSPNPETGGAFGFSLDLADRSAWGSSFYATLAVGAKFENAGGVDSGAAYVFRYDPLTDQWDLYSSPLPVDVGAFDAYGQEVSLSYEGRYLAVGAIRDDDKGLDAGAVYVMYDEGTQVRKYYGSDTEAGDTFGVAIDLYNSSRMLVGAVYEDTAGGSAGAAYLWTGEWLFNAPTSETFRISAPDGAPNDFFGIAVAMNQSSIAVGAEGDDDFGVDSGSVYVWDYDSAGNIAPYNLAKQYSPFPGAFDSFGNQLAGSNSSEWAASVRGGDSCSAEAGSLFFSDVDSTWPGHGGQLVCPPSSSSFDSFSTGIGLDYYGDWLVASAPNDDTLGQDAGSVHVWYTNWVNCNFNGTHDYREMVLNPALDCDLSATLDSCQINSGAPDCNSNGVLDTCDIAAGTSTDCNFNQVPDDCESLSDCNANGIPDSCDFASGTSEDCNFNGLPDECDIASGFSTDQDGNGVPDECEEVGLVYCDPAVANSTGQYGKIQGAGSNIASQNAFVLLVNDLPLNQFGYFLTGQDQGYTPFPGGSDGILCLSGNLGRFNRPGEVWNTSTSGSAAMVIDLTDIPINVGGIVLAGETWHYQAWHRDNMPGVSRSNFTTALRVMFQ